MPYLTLYIDGVKSARIPYDMSDPEPGYLERKVKLLKNMRPDQIRGADAWEIVIEGVRSKIKRSKVLTETDKAIIRKLHKKNPVIIQLSERIGFSVPTIYRVLRNLR